MKKKGGSSPHVKAKKKFTITDISPSSPHVKAKKKFTITDTSSNTPEVKVKKKFTITDTSSNTPEVKVKNIKPSQVKVRIKYKRPFHIVKKITEED